MRVTSLALQDWQFCARVAHPREFQKRLMKFDANLCRASFVARASQILEKIRYEDILKSSQAGATFFVFVRLTHFSWNRN